MTGNTAAGKAAAGKAARGKTPKVTAPRLSPVRLEELHDQPSPDFRRGEKYDGERFSRADADGLELSGTGFAECEFNGVSFNETQLRGATFRDCILAELYAPVLTAARATLRDIEISNPRWGSAELYENGWTSVRIDGGKLDYVNLRGSRLTDVQISDCIINELDLGSVTGTRVALKNCTIGTLDLAGAKLKDFDLRGTDFRTISGLGNLAGVVIDDYQLSLLAPLLAAHLGVVVL
ncbi:pentapeptide repeat-containing protein [Arthrobacter sp. ISL-72]|uniref:pentapeptide repeat-containing protein n=1 Tax=Arthrobacter sp. ISL-72 TaxID=2819114 RepID=UPI001BED0883|nr:pentapeptide repeat-containing protein [Arthrobacter sp. ISL-72]MBT2596555.1 pentapeptide repeat-containing protein [Arthrobacter sp. ISL-72]